MRSYSVIIPTLNEEKNIRECLTCVRDPHKDVEIIVVDGGSRDRTCAIARECGAMICVSDKGRGRQCNAGARQATGEVLIFLHADTKLPEDAFSQIDSLFQNEKVQIATFQMQFDKKHWLLGFYGYFTRFDSIWTTFGDQCIVMRKNFLDEMGGFPDWPLFEDVELFKTCRKKTKIYSMPGPVMTSARKFIENGLVRQQISNGLLILKYQMGVPPRTIGSGVLSSRSSRLGGGNLFLSEVVQDSNKDIGIGRE